MPQQSERDGGDYQGNVPAEHAVPVPLSEKEPVPSVNRVGLDHLLSASAFVMVSRISILAFSLAIFLMRRLRSHRWNVLFS